MKEKIGCPITLGEYEKIVKEEKEIFTNKIKKMLKENYEMVCEIFGEIGLYEIDEDLVSDEFLLFLGNI